MLDFLSSASVFKIYFQEYHQLSNSMDANKDHCLMEPDLGLNCLRLHLVISRKRVTSKGQFTWKGGQIEVVCRY